MRIYARCFTKIWRWQFFFAHYRTVNHLICHPILFLRHKLLIPDPKENSTPKKQKTPKKAPNGHGNGTTPAKPTGEKGDNKTPKKEKEGGKGANTPAAKQGKTPRR